MVATAHRLQSAPLRFTRSAISQKVLGRASESVELSHYQGVALADEIETGFKLGSFLDRRTIGHSTVRRASNVPREDLDGSDCDWIAVPG
jgi:hypothetical protein